MNDGAVDEGEIRRRIASERTSLLHNVDEPTADAMRYE